MKIFTCPHCHKKSISIWQKLFLSPFSMNECAACGARLSFSFLSRLICILPIVTLTIISRLDNAWKNDPRLSFVVIGLGFMLYLFLAPLVAKPVDAEEKN